jgi:hypothetical protein
VPATSPLRRNSASQEIFPPKSQPVIEARPIRDAAGAARRIDKARSGVYGRGNAWMAELVDARDLKSLEAELREGSSPSPGTNHYKGLTDPWPAFFLTIKFLSSLPKNIAQMSE